MKSIPPYKSRELIEALEFLLEAAKRGEIVGAVIGSQLKGGRGHHVSVLGAMVQDPTYARGVCSAIDDELRSLAQRRGPAASTFL